MTASNHVVSGSVFAAATLDILPIWVMLPIAFVLHFVLDALPHFGEPNSPTKALNRLRWFLPLDAAVGAAVLFVIFLMHPTHWLLMAAGGTLCASPDLWSAPRFMRFLRSGNPAHNTDSFSRFHARIQRYERPWGAYVEIVWFAVAAGLLWQFL